MQSTDREEFDKQLAQLCAGFDKPIGDRNEAYWKGLAKMSIIEFARCVEFALGEDGPEKLPTSGQVWKIRKQLKAQPSIALPLHAPQRASRDHLVLFANRLLLRHLIWRGGLGSVGNVASPELERCLKVKRDLILEFAPFVRARDEMATKGTFVEMFTRALAKVSALDERRWAELLKDPGANDLFDPRAVDGLSATGTLDL
jgi:hypothetical protein